MITIIAQTLYRGLEHLCYYESKLGPLRLTYIIYISRSSLSATWVSQRQEFHYKVRIKT